MIGAGGRALERTGWIITCYRTGSGSDRPICWRSTSPSLPL